MSQESKDRRIANQDRRIAGRVSTQLIQTSQTQFIGPIPPPEVLTKYNEALPNAAERIVAMAESQLRHRQNLETRVIESNCKAQQRGPVYGLIVCLAAIGGGVYLIHSGQQASGLAAIITPLVGIVGVFIYGKISQQRQLASQAPLVAPPPTVKSK
jgi:uncharacterized membrane protein